MGENFLQRKHILEVILKWKMLSIFFTIIACCYHGESQTRILDFHPQNLVEFLIESHNICCNSPGTDALEIYHYHPSIE